MKMKGQGFGIIFAGFIAWIFVVVMVGLAAQINNPACSSSDALSAIQNTPKPVVPTGGIIGDIVNAGAIVLQTIGYMINLVVQMFNPCSSDIPWFVGVGIGVPVGLILLMKAAAYLSIGGG